MKNIHSPTIPSILSVSILMATSAITWSQEPLLRETFEEMTAGEAPGGAWIVLRASDAQGATVEEGADSGAQEGGSKALRFTDSDESEGSFGPAARVPLPAGSSKLRFDFMLVSGRQFPGLRILTAKQMPVLELVLSTSDRERMIGYHDGEKINSLAPVSAGQWYRCTIDFGGKGSHTVLVEDSGGVEVLSTEIPRRAEGEATEIEFQLGGSSGGSGGDFLIDNMEVTE